MKESDHETIKYYKLFCKILICNVLVHDVVIKLIH